MGLYISGDHRRILRSLLPSRTGDASTNVPDASTVAAAFPGTMTDNMNYCAGLATAAYAGFDDWRVPTRIELASLVDDTQMSGDAVNPIFKSPTAEAHGYYRTSSLWYETIAGINGSTFAWIYNMGSGLTSNAYAQTSTASVRCVRGNGAAKVSWPRPQSRPITTPQVASK